MAIVVEEEKKSRAGVIGIVTWGLVFVIVAVAVYYVFFKQPALVEEVTPANFSNTEALSQINLAPGDVINNPSFQALHVYSEPLTPSAGGRVNPFLGNF